jgi:hypothetical protein
MRALVLSALVLISLTLGVSSPAATWAGAIVTSKAGKTYVLKGARCNNRGMHFGEWRGNGGVLSMKLEKENLPGRVELFDGYIDLRSAQGVYEAISGTVYVNPDRRSGRFNVWGRRGPGWASRTGHQWTGTWRCA